MNIFILSMIQKQCAMEYVDTHVVKILLEIAQMLCSAHIILDSVNSLTIKTAETVGTVVPLYKLAHKNHPCTVWTRASSANYDWLYDLFNELCLEYTYRYGKTHLCEKKFKIALKQRPKNIPEGPLTQFALAMPDDCKIDENPVTCYQEYYKKHKRHLAIWTKRPVPEWYH
jgi:hypothetical protein